MFAFDINNVESTIMALYIFLLFTLIQHTARRSRRTAASDPNSMATAARRAQSEGPVNRRARPGSQRHEQAANGGTSDLRPATAKSTLSVMSTSAREPSRRAQSTHRAAKVRTDLVLISSLNLTKLALLTN